VTKCVGSLSSDEFVSDDVCELICYLSVERFYFYALDVICDVVDVDECGTNNGNCSSAANCTNTVGGYNCTCLPGYTGDGFTCEGKSD